MTFLPGAALPSADDLLSIIRVQTEIARLGLDLDAVMGLAATACIIPTASSREPGPCSWSIITQS